MQHEGMRNGYVSLFQVKITSFYSFLMLNHEVLPIKIPSFYFIFGLLANVRISLTPPPLLANVRIWLTPPPPFTLTLLMDSPYKI